MLAGMDSQQPCLKMSDPTKRSKRKGGGMLPWGYGDSCILPPHIFSSWTLSTPVPASGRFINDTQLQVLFCIAIHIL